MKTYRALTLIAASLFLAGCASSQPSKTDATAKLESTMQEQRWIDILRTGDDRQRSDAVQHLVEHADRALPLLERRSKAEPGSGTPEGWWLELAMQECRESRLLPGDLYTSPDQSTGMHVNEKCREGTAEGGYTVVEHDGRKCWRMAQGTPGGNL